MINSKNLLFLIFFYALTIKLHNLSLNGVKELNRNNWREILNGQWMIKIFAPWCPACRALDTPWREFAQFGTHLDITVAEIDITKYPELSGRFLVTTLPTILHVKDGIFREVKGLYDKDKIISFVKDMQWKNISPLPSWKNPNTYHMAALGEFFRISMAIRDLHNYLVEDRGLPYWLSYILFILITIFIGGIMGIILVFFADYFTSKPQKPLKYSKLKKINEQKKEEDILAPDLINLIDSNEVNELANKIIEEMASIPKNIIHDSTNEPHIYKRK
ncbi:thioredoxin-related transmembrane protein 1-like isoform X2 [Gordionus sp. m RMFG-2023]|uniref:thioredoxin-related transmembrane protein 1-like isoform X2 n=1 Tax=Gordionus sp. m RMFG-2023 TaxID=3053472 RepID=UPI0031FCC50D